MSKETPHQYSLAETEALGDQGFAAARSVTRAVRSSGSYRLEDINAISDLMDATVKSYRAAVRLALRSGNRAAGRRLHEKLSKCLAITKEIAHIVERDFS